MLISISHLPGNVLFFGNRNQDGDFLYKDEWMTMVSNGDLELFTAFSRDQVSITSSSTQFLLDDQIHD